MSKFKISFCTVCMNRLEHLSHTLPINLVENPESYVEFVLLDYSSSDGVGKYIHSNFKNELHSGRLVYYRYDKATSFCGSHARNMAFRLSQGKIMVNLDADNFAGNSFANYTLNQFKENPAFCLTGLRNRHTTDAYGKVCLHKTQFYRTTGYDESFDGYGFEDFDFVNRLTLAGCQTYTITNPSYLRTIGHDISARLKNDQLFLGIHQIYIKYIDESATQLLFLLKNRGFYLGTVVNNFTVNSSFPQPGASLMIVPHHQFDVSGGWKHGTWELFDQMLHLLYPDSTVQIENINAPVASRKKWEFFRRIDSEQMKLDAFFFFRQSQNRDKMDSNLKYRRVAVNASFGRGEVYRNFSGKKISL
ncbi:glycosyltransferase family 2 protein [Flavitalea antarctica]